MAELLIQLDEFLCDRYVKEQITKHVDPSFADFNLDKKDAVSDPVSDILGSLESLPMMGGDRVVIVENCQKFKKDQFELLVESLKKVGAGVHVYLICDKIDKRTGFYKYIKKDHKILEFKAPYDNQVPAWVESYIKEQGLSCEAGCGELLATTVGTNLRLLISEIDKLATYVHPQKLITRQAIVELVGAGVVQNVFLMTENLGNRNLQKVIELYRQVRLQGEAPIRMVAMILQHFKKLILVQENNRKPDPQLAGQIGVHPFFLKTYRAQAGRFHPQKLKRAYSGLMELSEDLRSVSINPDTLMEEFLQDVCLN